MNQWLTGITATATLAAGMLFAQAPAPGHHPGMGHMGQMGQNGPAQHFEHMATVLNLTPQQREQAKAIFDAAKQSAEPIQAQLKQNRQALADAVKTGKGDADIDRLATSQGVLMGQMAAVHTKAMAKVYALLTPEQRQKADQLHQQFQQGFESRRFRGAQK